MVEKKIYKGKFYKDFPEESPESGFNFAIDLISNLEVSEQKLREVGWIKKEDVSVGKLYKTISECGIAGVVGMNIAHAIHAYIQKLGEKNESS